MFLDAPAGRSIGSGCDRGSRWLTWPCPAVSSSWKRVSHTPGSASVWTSARRGAFSQSSLFILATRARRPRGSPAPAPAPHTARVVLMPCSVTRPRHSAPTPAASSVRVEMTFWGLICEPSPAWVKRAPLISVDLPLIFDL